MTVDRRLLQQAERRARGRSRSKVIEDALRAAEQLDLVKQTVEYYRTSDRGERGEELSWGAIATHAAASWDDE